MSAESWIVDVDAANFEQVVIATSMRRPVLVDFWAPWCAPCKSLGPVLEKLARELDGAFVLAKIDTEKNSELASAFRVQSIPAVMLISGGNVADGFLGVRSEAEVREFLTPHLGAQPEPGQAEIEAAREHEQEGELEQAIQLLRGFLRENDDNAPVRIELARLLIAAERGAEAQKVLAKLTPEEAHSEAVLALRAQLETEGEDLDVLRKELDAEPQDIARRIHLGRALIARGNPEEGLEELLEAARRDLTFEDGAARKALIETFELLGSSHPLTNEFRQRLSVLICS